jgi:hypothetical protein
MASFNIKPSSVKLIVEVEISEVNKLILAGVASDELITIQLEPEITVEYNNTVQRILIRRIERSIFAVKIINLN